jgi:hypothetical protein
MSGTSGPPAGPKSPAPSRSVPWGLVASLGVVGLLGGWFYRNSKSSSNQRQLLTQLKSRLVLSPEEVVEAREANRLSVRQFRELARRAALHPGVVPRDFYSRFVADQLGGEFQARGGLNAAHLFERLAAKLGSAPPSALTLVCGLAIAVRADPPNELLEALFDVASEPAAEQQAARDVIDRSQFEQVLAALVATDQLPARVLVAEKDVYPVRLYHEASARELADHVLAKEQNLVTKSEFVDLLLSKGVCVWGACTAAR